MKTTVPKLVVWAAAIASFCLIFSFIAFAKDQASDASENQTNAVNQAAGKHTGEAQPVGAPVTYDTEGRPSDRGPIRRNIDKVNDALVNPIESIVQTNNIWANHIITLIAGLLIYGLGGAFLASYLRKM